MESKREMNYWPGFVDALSGLTLALVLIMVIFVVAMFSFAGQLAEKKAASVALSARAMVADEIERTYRGEVDALKHALNAKDGERARDEATITDLRRQLVLAQERQRQPVGKYRPEMIEADRKETPQDRGAGILIEESAGGDVTVRFPVGLVSLSAEERNQLRQVFSKLPGAGMVYEVEASVGTETYSEARRNAYFRLMGVRNLMIESGVSPERMKPRINDANPTGRAGEGTITLRLRRP